LANEQTRFIHFAIKQTGSLFEVQALCIEFLREIKSWTPTHYGIRYIDGRMVSAVVSFFAVVEKRCSRRFSDYHALASSVSPKGFKGTWSSLGGCLSNRKGTAHFRGTSTGELAIASQPSLHCRLSVLSWLCWVLLI
jgi:hypothetical protein